VVEWLERNRSNLAVVLVVLVTVAGVTLLQLPRRPALQIAVSADDTSEIKVHVVGAVRSPGVYSLEAGSRVEDAVKAAGGPADNVDPVALNLATLLRDGQQVVVPELPLQPRLVASTSNAATATQPTPLNPSPKIDLNSATRQQLESLPGIGQVLAQRILDHRQKNGRFQSVEELKDAKLVNASTYEKVRELVEVR